MESQLATLTDELLELRSRASSAPRHRNDAGDPEGYLCEIRALREVCTHLRGQLHRLTAARCQDKCGMAAVPVVTADATRVSLGHSAVPWKPLAATRPPVNAEADRQLERAQALSRRVVASLSAVKVANLAESNHATVFRQRAIDTGKLIKEFDNLRNQSRVSSSKCGYELSNGVALLGGIGTVNVERNRTDAAVVRNVAIDNWSLRRLEEIFC